MFFITLFIKIIILAMIMTFTPFAPIPIYFIYKVATLGSKAFLPSDDWGPNKSIDNTGISKVFFFPNPAN